MEPTNKKVFTEVNFGDNAFDKIQTGMSVVYNAVAGTIGAAGRNAVLSQYGSPIITNDGISIARRIKLKDETEDMGAQLITQTAEKTNEEVQDATSTSVVLTYALVTQGQIAISKGHNPMVLKRQMEDSVKDICNNELIGIPVDTDEMLFNVANTSMENPTVAKIVAEAVKTAGVDGMVFVEESRGLDIEKEEIEGFSFDKGYTSPYMITNPAKMECVFNDVPVLVTDKKFVLITDIFPLIEALSKRGQTKLVIISNGVEHDALKFIIDNRVAGKFHATVINKPFDKDLVEDIAISVGAVYIPENEGQITSEHVLKLGFAKKIVVKKDSTSIVGGGGNKEKISERIESIKNQIDKATDYEKNKLKERLAKLVNKVVVLKVGAPTEASLKYLKLKVDDAVGSARSAYEQGIVAGGGRALRDISLKTPKNEGDSVVRIACSNVMFNIVKNAGVSNIEETIMNLPEGAIFNAVDGSICLDPIGTGIVDSVKAQKSALTNAVKQAATILTLHTTIVEVEE